MKNFIDCLKQEKKKFILFVFILLFLNVIIFSLLNFTRNPDSDFNNFVDSGMSKKDFIVGKVFEFNSEKANHCAELGFNSGNETLAIKCFYAVYYSEIEK